MSDQAPDEQALADAAAVDESSETILLRVTGRDRPGITTQLLGILAAQQVLVDDIEQVVIRDRLTLGLVIRVPDGRSVLKDVLYWAWGSEVTVDFEVVESVSSRAHKPRHVVTALAHQLSPAALQAVTGAIADAGGNIDRILRLSKYPVVSFEFAIVDGDLATMRASLVEVAAEYDIDVSVERELFGRRARRLIMLDVDSTLITSEMIDLLAAEAGSGDEVAAITERAMNGELDFTESLTARVATLEGLEQAALDRVREQIQFTAGARTFVRTLKRLGYSVGIVSGGFTYFTDWIRDELGLDHAYANTLEIVNGKLTGKVTGEIVDRANKATILRRLADEVGVGTDQTIAVGDGANDLDMLAAAGLGIAFNAKAVVSEAADTSVSVPYLDAILFMLGIRREDVEIADSADGIAADVVDADPRLPIH